MIPIPPYRQVSATYHKQSIAPSLQSTEWRCDAFSKQENMALQHKHGQQASDVRPSALCYMQNYMPVQTLHTVPNQDACNPKSNSRKILQFSTLKSPKNKTIPFSTVTYGRSFHACFPSPIFAFRVSHFQPNSPSCSIRLMLAQRLAVSRRIYILDDIIVYFVLPPYNWKKYLLCCTTF